MPSTSFRIAPRSAGAVVDPRLLHVARMDPPAGTAAGTFLGRLRSRLARARPGA